VDEPRILVDFAGATIVPMPLSHADTVVDSQGKRIRLHEGMAVRLFQPDTDWYGRDDYRLADGTVTWDDPDQVHGPQWCVLLDERGVRRESDEPGFAVSALPAAQRREKMYQHIEASVSLVAEPDRAGIKDAVATWVAQLRQIDAGEHDTGTHEV
jgi:hypothetical protein